MAHKLEDRNRRLLNYKTSKVKSVVPEFFHSEYPSLVTFLEAYYDFMDSDDASSFDTEISNLYSIRDISETPEKYLNQIIYELGAGLTNGSIFQDARFSTKRFADLYLEKGSKKSVEEFFRAFFGQEVEIVFPKNNLFIVGESRIGVDSLRYIQDYAKYQLYSIVLKGGLGVDTYRDLYKKFIHPAGWYFEGEASVIGEAVIAPRGITPWGDSTDVISTANVDPSIVSEVIMAEPLISATTIGVYDSHLGSFTGDIDINFINQYQDKTVEELDRFFNIRGLYDVNSFTFDDSNDPIDGPDFSMTYDSYNITFDKSMFKRYLVDSSF